MTTTVVYADTTDGYISSDYFNSSGAQSGGSLTAITGSAFRVGQWNDSGNFTYYVYEAFVQFNTSGIGTDTVSSAVLSLYTSDDNSTTDFTVEARVEDWGTSLTTGDWVPRTSLASKTLLAHFATSGWNVASYHDFVDDAFPVNVIGSGQTRMLLDSNRHVAGDSPSDAEYVDAYSADQTGTTQDPKLTITHEAGAAENHDASVTATGGGAATVAGVAGRITGRGRAPFISTWLRSPDRLRRGIWSSDTDDAEKAVWTDWFFGFGVENHDASVTATGGGIAAIVILGAHTNVATATGGGVATVAWQGAHVKDATATGGGIAAIAPKGAHNSSTTATGGGAATVAPVAGRQSAVTATGGGSVVIALVTRRTLAATATGGGVVAITETTARMPSAQATGGGVVAVDAAAVEFHDETVNATGSGVVAVDPTSARNLSAVATGAGIASVSVTSARSVDANATGGGMVTVDGVVAGNATASVQATGGGIVTIDAEAAIGGNVDASVNATGGGRVVLSTVGEHPLPAGVPLGSGAYRMKRMPRRRVSVHITGGGVVRIDAEAWWNDDDLVLELLNVA